MIRDLLDLLIAAAPLLIVIAAIHYERRGKRASEKLAGPESRARVGLSEADVRRLTRPLAPSVHPHSGIRKRDAA